MPALQGDKLSTGPGAAAPSAAPPHRHPHLHPHLSALWRVLAWVTVAGVLGGVAMAYFEPDLLLGVAASLWRCF